MPNNFRVKTLLADSIRVSGEIAGNNLLYTTGNQNISGIKNFYSRPTINGTGILLSGDITSQPEATGVSGYLQGQITVLNNQTGSYALKSETGLFVTTSQTGAFYAASNPSGFITGVNLSNYSTIPYTTGISGVLQSQISNLNSGTGYYALKSETGSFLTDASANSLYVNVTGDQTITGIKTFSTNIVGSGTLVINNNIQSNNGNVSASASGSLNILGRSKIYSSSDGAFQFRNNANDANATGIFGAIGIGTSAPAQLMHVVGNGARIKIESNYAFANPVLELAGTSFTNFLFAGSDGAWNLRTDSATRPVYIQSIGNQGGSIAQGNVQIGGISGVSTPNSQLVVRSNFNNVTGNLLELQGYSGNQVLKVSNIGDLTSSGVSNRLPNQTSASPDYTFIATQGMTAPFPTFGGPPPMYRIFEDFPVQNANPSYIGTHGWYFNGSISNPSFATSSGPLCYGAIQLTSAASSGSAGYARLLTNGTNAVGGAMHALFAIPDPTNASFFMGFAGGGSTDHVYYIGTSGAWITRKNQGSNIDNTLLTTGLSGGDFTSGTRYKVSWSRPSTTTTSVHIATAPWNIATWTTIYNNTVTHTSWNGGWGQIQPHIGIIVDSGTTGKSIIVDYVGIEFTTQR
jgi:hypothetical protein